MEYLIYIYNNNTFTNFNIKYKFKLPGFLNVYLTGSRFFSIQTCLRILFSCVFGLIRATYS